MTEHTREVNPWRAGCGESRMPGSEGGVRKRAEKQRALPLPYEASRQEARLDSERLW